MSKPTQTPTILKKDNSTRQRDQKPASNQPKILTKANNNKEIPVKKEIIEISDEIPSLKTKHSFLYPHFNIDQKFFDYLDNENTDFLVVAAIGQKNVGKSTLLNLIADQNYVNIHDGSFHSENEIFNTKTSQTYEGSEVSGFITTDRIILLDPSPLTSNVQRRDMIVAESDDLKMLLALFQLCHLIVVVHNGFPDLSLLRLIHLAEKMIPSDVKHRPVFVYVGNNMQPGTKLMPIDARIHSECSLMLPNFQHRSLKLHHDVAQIIQDYQEKIYMLKRYSLLENEEEIFNERKWAQRVNQVMESLKGEYFLRKYDGLRDTKFHQAVEGS